MFFSFRSMVAVWVMPNPPGTATRFVQHPSMFNSNQRSVTVSTERASSPTDDFFDFCIVIHFAEDEQSAFPMSSLVPPCELLVSIPEPMDAL